MEEAPDIKIKRVAFCIVFKTIYPSYWKKNYSIIKNKNRSATLLNISAARLS